jgi:hypothetical protein
MMTTFGLVVCADALDDPNPAITSVPTIGPRLAERDIPASLFA